MKKLFLSIALVVLGASMAYSAEIPVPKFKCGPWVVGVTETEMTIVWTSTERCMGWVEVAPDDGSSFYAEERPRYYEDFLGRHLVTKVHHVRLTGLKAGTTYRYRVYQQGVDDSGHSPVSSGKIIASSPYDLYKIKTLDTSKSEINFSMINDIHGRDSIMTALTKDFKSRKDLDFVVFNGDMASFMGSIEDVEKDFLQRASKSFAPHKPLVYVRGNHETRGPGFSEFMNLFPSKTGTPSYLFRQGPAAFLVLDCGEDKPDSDMEYGGTAAYDAYRESMAQWLAETIESEEYKSAPVKIVLMHIPFEEKAGWWGNNELKRLLLPLLNKADVDLMMSGHTHRYSFREKGTSGGNEFPILVNGNNDRVDVKVTTSRIELKVIDATGKQLHQHTIDVK